MPLKTEELDPTILTRINAWLDGNYDADSKEELRTILAEDSQKATDAFYTDLAFGTGGMRGLMGVGTNRMNRYTVRRATQGLAEYLLDSFDEASVAISYDSRHRSQEFAYEAARVLAANGITAHVMAQLRPTPQLSFAVRHLKCQAGIMITASHNPPQYNGYKLYWDDGAQVLPPHDKEVIRRVVAITELDTIAVADIDSPLIRQMGAEIDEAYFTAVSPLQHCPEIAHSRGHELHIVYSSLHGAGTTMVPAVLSRWGFTHVDEVQEQREPDGAFPTTTSPNPEDREAMELGIAQMLKDGADLLVATDPDVDRVGVAINHGGQAVLLNGNQIACLCLYHVCESLSSGGKLPSNSAFVKTIVTTEMFRTIVESYEGSCFDVLTGFKYVAEKIRQWEQEGSYQYIFGGEESYGYLRGTMARDKDAIVSSAILCEAALLAKLEGKTLVNRLHELYCQYGVYRERLCSLKFPETQAGRKQMEEGMRRLRDNSPHAIVGIGVKTQLDYSEGVRDLPKSNVLKFLLDDGSWLVVRPSGTEPKVKVYAGTVSEAGENVLAAIDTADSKLQAMLDEVADSLRTL